METTPISEAEAMVMEVLWRSSPRSAEEVIAALAGDTGWAEPTVKTLLNRLLNKGAIELLQSKYNGKAFLLRSPNGNDWMTLAEWNAEFKTDGLEVLARMRWEWHTKGGGVGTPGQRVAGAGQVGHAKQTDPSKFKKLGKW